jgi:transcription elongation GreA/GreB family factor
MAMGVGAVDEAVRAAIVELIRQERRLSELQELLRLTKTGESPTTESVAAPGMVLTIRYEDDDDTEQFLLATREVDARYLMTVYSPSSPLGRALLGAREGEQREYELPNGSYQRVRLVKLRSYDEYSSELRRAGREATSSSSPPPKPPIAKSAASTELAATHQSAVGGLRRIFQRFVTPVGVGADVRHLPISIYLASAVNASEVELAVVDVLDAFDVDVTETMPPVIGSWFGLMLGRFRRRLTSAQADEVVARIERAVEVRLLDQPQADVDLKQAESVARLMTALENQESACIQVGSLFLIKVDGTVIARNLSPRELTFLSGNPTIMSSPRHILMALEKFRSPEEEPPRHEPRMALPQPEAKPHEP